MQLTAFRIFKYRNIEDSGLVKLADRLTRKELQELRRMPYLSDIGRETADKAERLFTFINSRFSA